MAKTNRNPCPPRRSTAYLRLVFRRVPPIVPFPYPGFLKRALDPGPLVHVFDGHPDRADVRLFALDLVHRRRLPETCLHAGGVVLVFQRLARRGSEETVGCPGIAGD